MMRIVQYFSSENARVLKKIVDNINYFAPLVDFFIAFASCLHSAFLQDVQNMAILLSSQ